MNRLIKTIFLSILLLLVNRSVLGLFKEQKGEHDWSKQLIGAVSDGFFLSQKDVVCTVSEKAVIACLQNADGSLKWRSIVTGNQAIQKSVVGGDSLYTLSSFANTLVITAWSVDNGSIRWQLNLQRLTPVLTTVDAFDLALYDEAGHLVALVGGELILVSDLTSSLPTHWRWNDSKQSQQKKEELALISLAGTKTISDKVSVAVGCYVDSGADRNSVCNAGVRLTVDFKKRSISEVPSKFPKVPIKQILPLSPIVDDALGFSFEVAPSKVDVSFSSAGTKSTLSLPLVAANGISALSFLLISEDDFSESIGAVVSLCSSKECFLVAPFTDDNELKPRIIHTCAGDAVAIFPDRSFGHANTAVGFTCASLQGPSVALTHVGHRQSPSSTALSNEKLFTLTTQVPLVGSTFSAVSFAHVSVVQTADKRITGNKRPEPKVAGLFQTSSGLLAFLTGVDGGDNKISKGTSNVGWVREEGYSDIRGVVLVDNVDVVLDVVTDSEEMPSFSDRLQLQLKALAGFDFFAVINYDDVLRSVLPAALATRLLTTPNKAVTKRANQAMSITSGYNKMAVTLAAVDSRVVVFGINVLSASTAWSLELLDNDGTPFSFSNIATSYVLETRKAVGVKASLVTVLLVGNDNALYSWQIDASSGYVVKSVDDHHNRNVVLMNRLHLGNLLVHSMMRRVTGVSTKLANIRVLNVVDSDSLDHHRHQLLLFVQDTATGRKGLLSLPQQNDNHSAAVYPPADLFLHHVDRNSGVLEIFKTAAGSMDLEETTNIVFPPSEIISYVAYPSVGDQISSRSIVLGDDSVLLKYLNPHFVVVATVSSETGGEPYYSPEAGNKLDSFVNDVAAVSSTLTLYLIDTVSGKTILKTVHENGAAPVYAVIIENNIVATYWNCKTKRTELASVALFEDLVDKYALNPIAFSSSSPVVQKLGRNTNFSAYSTSLPLSMFKSYVLPRSVAGIASTHTSKGIANKNVLLALTTGQLYSLDMRHVHPRRPDGEPTLAEREEGLMKYSPIILFNPLGFVTLDETVQGHLIRDRSVLISSATTRLESTSLILSHWGLDLHFNLAMPSQGFDSLASDFNYSLLVLILSLLCAAVVVMQRYAHKKQLKAMWA